MTSDIYQLDEYEPLDYFVTHIELEIDLSQSPIATQASLSVVPNPQINSAHAKPLVLHGEHMILTGVFLDNIPIQPESYIVSSNALTILNLPDKKSFVIKTTTSIQEHTDLFGLYKTDGIILIKSESEGLRRVIYCVDRPDNLATYRTKITANITEFPILLSNGVLEHSKKYKNGLRTVTWYDKLPKPSYLFAMVAGKLLSSEAHYDNDNRHILITCYLSAHAILKSEYAKEVLKQAIFWDETTCGLACDLSHYMIACVDRYASGASETTGLNLFNAENFLATPESKTDSGFLRILEVVSHEYFHYWTGNRVTIRDWFNLSFKEGLTTLRSALFRSDLLGSDIVRLIDGKNLDERAPRPESYTAVRSLYTAAAYEKSADIFRMMMLSIGREAFLKKTTEFLLEYDGKAVTLEEYIDFLSKVTQRDLHSFIFWFTEAGIPEISVTDFYDPISKIYTLTFNTTNAAKRPIPCIVGLFDQAGKELVADTVLWITESQMEFRFPKIASKPVPSLFRSFSAPVKWNYDYTDESLLLLMKHDSNQYNRVEVSRVLITRLVTRYCEEGCVHLTPQFFDTYHSLLKDESLNPWILAELMTLVSQEYLITTIKTADFKKIAEACLYIEKNLAEVLRQDLFQLFNSIQEPSVTPPSPFEYFNMHEASKRRLKAIYYSYFQHTDVEATIRYLRLQFNHALGKNMTETISALTLLCHLDSTEADPLLEAFYLYWQNDSNAMNYWFMVQAAAHTNTVISRVSQLMQHPCFEFSNPNRVYALLGPFIKNPYGFHNESGEGYLLLAEVIIRLDHINPALAASLCNSFVNWDKYNHSRQSMMYASLEHIASEATSKDLLSMLEKGLAKTKDPD